MKIKVYDVFADRLFTGNPTGVIFWHGQVNRTLMQQITKELNLPDCIFLYDITPGEEIIGSSLTFSPFEELSVCGQGMVGAFNALQEEFSFPEGIYQLRTAAGIRKILWKDHIAFASVGQFHAMHVNDYMALRNDLGILLPETEILDLDIIDISRKRLLIKIDIACLPQLALLPDSVMRFCARYHINGLVVFAQLEQNLVRSRVYTTSLNGAEDAVTGGASAAILVFLIDRGFSDDHLIAYQGDFITRGGKMYVSHDAEKNRESYVGGQCHLFSTGTLYADNGIQ